MAVACFLPALLGSFALLSTAALLTMHIVLAASFSDTRSPVRITAVASSALEGANLVVLAWCLFTCLRATSPSTRRIGLWFALSILLAVVAGGCCTAALVCLGNAKNMPTSILGSAPTPYLGGAAVVLGVAFVAQLFFAAHFLLCCNVGARRALCLRTDDSFYRSPQAQVKSIRYSQTTPQMLQVCRDKTPEPEPEPERRSPTGSNSARSAFGLMSSSIRSSFSNVARPVSSKSRLLPAAATSMHHRSTSQRSSLRAQSLDSDSAASVTRQERNSLPEDGFDSWDTSAVDPHNRTLALGVVRATTSLLGLGGPGRSLETIPASPTTSRSPSPDTPLDLEPPRTRRRSRSYSPASTTWTRQNWRPGPGPYMQQGSAASSSESHIHPLFRSDSRMPPPMATPATIVTAAPDAARVISDKQSIWSLNRKRSASMPMPRPVSRQGRFESFSPRQSPLGGDAGLGLGLRGVEAVTDEEEERVENPEAEVGERKMTPPIPEWILTAGSRTSLVRYNSQKVKDPAC